MTEFDEFHFHELLDRTCIVQEIVESALLTHPLPTENPTTREMNKIHSLIQSAAADLATAYQLIGEMHYGKPTKQGHVGGLEHQLLDSTQARQEGGR